MPVGVQSETKPGILLSGLLSGLLMGFSGVIFTLSLGSLVFSGDLTAFLPYGIGMALASTAIMMVAVALLSSVPGVIGATQDSSSVILAVIAAGLAANLSTVHVEERLATVLVAIATTTLLTGIFLLALGLFKLGGLVRYIPYPVVGGFLAGTGWLLAKGSFGVMSNVSLKLANLPELFSPEQLITWVPGVIFALVLFFGLRRFRHFLVMPGILVGGAMLFYLSLLVTGTTFHRATELGLLLGVVSGDAIWRPPIMENLLAVNWSAILGQSGNIAITIILSMVGLLLNVSALELVIRKDVNLNRELQSAGIANILSGFGGGMVGYHVLSFSALSYRMGARGRLPGLISGAICAAMLFNGSALLTYFPKPVLGGLLLFLGLDFLSDWVIAGWKKLSRIDYAVVLLILVVIGTTDFLIGVGVGLVVMIILFVLNYSRINVIYHAVSGKEMSSNVKRCTYHRRVLTEELGLHIYILELQGFIFFGTANAILEQIYARLADKQQPQARYILLDFRRVTGLDSSAGLSFSKCQQLAEAQNIILVLTHLSDNIQRQLSQSHLSEKHKNVRIFVDLDHGLEWCEEQLLEIEQITTYHTPITLSAQLADSGFEKARIVRLKEFLEQVKFKEGDYLLHQGDDADMLYFIEMGTVSVYLEMGGNARVRLQTYGLGTAVGEMDLYQRVKCPASIVADSPVTAYRLTRTALSEMKTKEPELAATFHEFFAQLLSERLATTIRTLTAVAR